MFTSFQITAAAVFHCTFPLHFSTAHFHCTFPLNFSTALFHCTFPLHFSTSLFHFTFPLHFSTAHVHRTFPQHFLTCSEVADFLGVDMRIWHRFVSKLLALAVVAMFGLLGVFPPFARILQWWGSLPHPRDATL